MNHRHRLDFPWLVSRALNRRAASASQRDAAGCPQCAARLNDDLALAAVAREQFAAAPEPSPSVLREVLARIDAAEVTPIQPIAIRVPATPIPLGIAARRQVRAFLAYGFAISVVLHLAVGPFVRLPHTQVEEERPHAISITKIKPPPSPTPTPRPTPTPPPRATPPPATPAPKRPARTRKVLKIKVNTAKTSNVGTGPVEHENTLTSGSTTGVPEGTQTALPAPAATAAAGEARVPAPLLPPPAPAPPSPRPQCAVPNVSPHPVAQAAPEVPEIAQQSGNANGTVEVQVDLDASSSIVGARVFKSTNPSLNAAALAATKQSRFQTEIVNCKPQPASYLYIVEFASQ